MAYTYLGLTNRVLKALNEVPLTSSNFSTTTTGFHAEVKDAINQSILDIYHEEDLEWPFAWSTTTFNTVVGTQEYTKDSAIDKVDWDSFQVKKATITLDSITQSSGTATGTVSAGHQLQVGDSITIEGANESDYNSTFEVLTVPTTTTFTFTVSSSATSPATGTITYRLPYSHRSLLPLNYDTWRTQWKELDLNANSDSYQQTECVIRRNDNNIIITPIPDRIYTIEYAGFAFPTALSAHGDIPTIPEEFEQVIVDRAMYYAYMFRDNLEQATLSHNKYENNVNRMRRILIPQVEYVRFTT